MTAPKQCARGADCLLPDGHEDGCACVRDLPREALDAAKRVGTRWANAAAERILRALGHEVKP